MLLRSVLAWTIYFIIPHIGGHLVRDVPSDEEWPDTVSHGLTFLGSLAHTISFAFAFVALVLLSRLWRDTVDVACVKFSQWTEDLVLGKTNWGWTLGLGPIRIQFVDSAQPFGNGHAISNGIANGHVVQKDLEKAQA